MRGDIPAPAFRLSCALPVRTNERRYIQQVPGPKNQPHVIVGGVEYTSIYQASLKIGKARATIKRMIEKGKARYA